jgi:FtsP/CotA-like multicopper oxidase with cupredoxin domain
MSDGIPFSCDPPEASPATPGFVTPAQAATLKSQGVIRNLVQLSREVRTDGQLTLPDGTSVQIWSFSDGTERNPYPSPVIRATERDLLQVSMHGSHGPHTIHHHGIEPDAFNDGVGHTSFEANDYTYQFQPHHAGTFIYHCHRNTTLHFQQGLWGPMVFDPDPALDPPVPAGYRRMFAHGPLYKIANERIWGVSAIDPRWHNFDHQAGLCGEDVGLNDFRPQYFLINRSAQPRGLITPADPITNARPPITASNVAVTARTREPILLRIICATYFPMEIQFGDPAAPPVIAEDCSSDGRPYRTTTDFKGSTAGATAERLVTRFLMSPAERYDLLLNTQTHPLAPGIYPVTIVQRHWLSGGGIGIREVGLTKTQLTITS